MKLNPDQITRLQRAFDLTRQAQTEIIGANLSADVQSHTGNIIGDLSTAVSSLQNILQQNGQKITQAATGTGR